jgi:hypothetical protein
MKKATLALAGLMAVSAAATASQSRWNGFGASNQFIADVQDIWTLPGVVATNADATYFEFGATAGFPLTGASVSGLPAGAWGGVHKKMGPGVLGLWFNRPYGELTASPALATALPAPTTGAAPSTVILAPVNTIDVLYGFSISDTLDLGIGITKAGAGLKTEITAGGVTTLTEQSTGDLGISLGGEIKEVGPIALLEVGLQYNMRDDVNTNNNGTITNKYKNSGTDMDLRIGGDIKGENGAAQRFEVGFGTEALSTKVDFAAAPASNAYSESKRSASGWLLGYAMSKSNDKGMGLGGLILAGGSTGLDEANSLGADTVMKVDSSAMMLTAVTAGEAKVKEWLTARAGLSSILFGSGTVTTEAGPTGSTGKMVVTTQVPAPNAVISTGLSLTFGDIVIDGVLNQDVLYTGTYLISGVPEGLFGQVSATWSWGGKE